MDSHHYYASMHGRWRGAFRLVVTDPGALSRLSLAHRLQARLTALLFRVVGHIRLDTTLDYRASGREGRVLHTTRASWGGFPLLRGEEEIRLHPDGRTGTMSRTEWAVPWPFPLRDGPRPLTVAVDAAVYELWWMGGPMRQTTRVLAPGRLQLVQETAWSRGEVVLERGAADV